MNKCHTVTGSSVCHCLDTKMGLGGKAQKENLSKPKCCCFLHGLSQGGIRWVSFDLIPLPGPDLQHTSCTFLLMTDKYLCPFAKLSIPLCNLHHGFHICWNWHSPNPLFSFVWGWETALLTLRTWFPSWILRQPSLCFYWSLWVSEP